MPDREKFKSSVAVIAQDAKEETGAFIARLKTMSAEEFVRLPREDLERLSITQYMGVARTIAPDVQSALAMPVPVRTPPRKKSRSRSVWFYVFAASAGIALGLAGAFAGPSLIQALDNDPIVRPAFVGTWPHCRRLNPGVDGCVYRPEQDLSWGYAAAMLGMNIDTLRNNNLHLPADRIPAASKLVVWRHRGILEN